MDWWGLLQIGLVRRLLSASSVFHVSCQKAKLGQNVTTLPTLGSSRPPRTLTHNPLFYCRKVYCIEKRNQGISSMAWQIQGRCYLGKPTSTSTVVSTPCEQGFLKGEGMLGPCLVMPCLGWCCLASLVCCYDIAAMFYCYVSFMLLWC